MCCNNKITNGRMLSKCNDRICNGGKYNWVETTLIWNSAMVQFYNGMVQWKFLNYGTVNGEKYKGRECIDRNSAAKRMCHGSAVRQASRDDI